MRGQDKSGWRGRAGRGAGDERKNTSEKIVHKYQVLKGEKARETNVEQGHTRATQPIEAFQRDTRHFLWLCGVDDVCVLGLRKQRRTNQSRRKTPRYCQQYLLVTKRMYPT